PLLNLSTRGRESGRANWENRLSPIGMRAPYVMPHQNVAALVSAQLRLCSAKTRASRKMDFPYHITPGSILAGTALASRKSRRGREARMETRLRPAGRTAHEQTSEIETGSGQGRSQQRDGRSAARDPRHRPLARPGDRALSRQARTVREP